MYDATFELLERYFRAYNARDIDGLLALMHDQVIHDLQCSRREVGKQAFARFLATKHALYDEHVYNLTLLVHPDGGRAAAEYQVLGFALGKGGRPPEPGGTYRVAAGTFFDIREERISRISSYGLRRELWGQAA